MYTIHTYTAYDDIMALGQVILLELRHTDDSVTMMCSATCMLRAILIGLLENRSTKFSIVNSLTHSSIVVKNTFFYAKQTNNGS